MYICKFHLRYCQAVIRIDYSFTKRVFLFEGAGVSYLLQLCFRPSLYTKWKTLLVSNTA